MSMLLEIACFNITAAMIAAMNGADRIELCDNREEGGTTPSYGTLITIKKWITIPIFPIIRPRGGDFLYSAAEFECMKADVQLCKDAGFEGVVLGLLLADGEIDIKRTKQLVQLAYPMEVTFHRAFDRAKQPLKALQQVIDTGCSRILTSGQKPTAVEGIPCIHELIEAANHEIIIMPGSGVRANNLLNLAQQTNAHEFHSSAGSCQSSLMQYHHSDMLEQLTFPTVDATEILLMKKILHEMDM